jgi:effector-binding domain-containing protein
MMIDKPEILSTPAQRTAVITLSIPRDQIRTVMGPGIQELMETVRAQGIGPTGPWYTHHLMLHPDRWDFDIGVPVSAPVTPAGRVKPGERPALKVARTVYHGPYEGLATAWPELDGWIKAQGMTPAQDLWECYVAGPESGSDPSTWRTELSRPLVG